MVVYNLTGINSVVGLVPMASFVNSESGGFLALGLILLLWILSFSILSSNFERTKQAWIGASIFCLMITMTFVSLGWMTDGKVILFLIAFLIAGLGIGALVRD